MKKIAALITLLSLICLPASAEELILSLTFSKPGPAKVMFPRKPAKTREVAGTVILDITPYPEQFEQNRYVVQYYLDDQELVTIDKTLDAASSERQLSFAYSFDSTLYPDGPHRITVNYSDHKGPSAIGMTDVIIVNKKK